MDWDGFRVLLAVADGGSLSAAAGALGVSQPTVGRAIIALEAALGARVLVRRTTGVVLTPAGDEVVAEARRMAEGASAALRRATGQGTDPRVPVRIAVTEGLGALWLPRRLAPLARESPLLRLELLVANAVADLSSRQADIAIRLFRPREPDLVARKVGSLGFALFAAPSYLAVRKAPRSVADLARHDAVGFPEGGVVPSPGAWLQRAVPPERFVLRTASLLAQHEAARAGFGVVVGTRVLLAGDPRLARLLPRARVPSMDIWLAVHGDVRRNAGVARVFEHLLGVFAQAQQELI
jgi:DNA-binding transcriptional LysR family regulator